jgi:peptidoglycan/xylan/chitin deacetylase (PgdA/CDA1 family)
VRDLWQLCHRLPTWQQEGAMAQLRAAAHDSGARASHRVMSEDEMRRAARNPLVEIGAHSVTHAALRFVSSAEKEREIRASKEWLEQRLGQPVGAFAYPYGRPSDYDEDVVRLVRQAGFEAACANVAGGVTSATDPYQLPRLFVQDWDGDEFARRVFGASA